MEREPLSGATEKERDYLVQRMEMDAEYGGLTGRSSDALVVAAFTGEGPYITEYPLDRADWRRCLLAYALAPEHLRERMRPAMRDYREHLAPQYRRWSQRWQFPRTSALNLRRVACPSCGAVVAWEGERPTDCLRCGFPLDRGCRYCDDDPVGYDALGRVACAEHIAQIADDLEEMP